MNPHPAAPFSDRLKLARRMIARGPSHLPDNIVDQLDAAGRETRMLHDRLGQVLPFVDPGRNWRQRDDRTPSDETRVLLLAAVLGCTALCVHLRRGGPQPAFCRLPLRRVDCARCSQIFIRPPSSDSDRCDVCTADEITIFHPFAVNRGPLMIAGDACPACAEVLGIAGIEEAAS